MSGQTRKLTIQEIDDYVMPKIAAVDQSLRNQNAKIQAIRSYLQNIDVKSAPLLELLNIVLSDYDAGQKIQFIRGMIEDPGKWEPGVIQEINELIQGKMTSRDRLANLYQELADTNANQTIYDKLEITDWDYPELIQKFLNRVGHDHDPYNTIAQIANAFNDNDPSDLVDRLKLFAETYRSINPNYDNDFAEFIRMLNRRGHIVWDTQLRKALEIDEIATHPEWVDIITQDTASDEIVIERLAKYLREHETTDISKWVLELLEGGGTAFTQLRKEYDDIYNWIAENITPDKDTIKDIILAEPVKVAQKLVNLGHHIDEVSEIFYPFATTVKKSHQLLIDYLRSGGGLRPQDLEHITRQTILEIIWILNYQREGHPGDPKTQMIRGLLLNQEVVDGEVENFVNDYITNMPRELTPPEIADILSVVPAPVGDRVAARFALESMKLKLTQQLRRYKITPKGIPILKERIRKQSLAARQVSGTPVGAQSATAIGSVTTQQTLNTFHTAGSALNVTSGIERITQLLGANKDFTKAGSIIYYKSKIPFSKAKRILEQGGPDYKDIGWSMDEIFQKIQDIIGNYVYDVILKGGEEIINAREISEHRPYWYDIHSIIYNQSVDLSSWVLRIKLDPLMLLKYHITMEDIVNSIYGGTWYEDKKCVGVNGIIMIWSPDGDGIDSDEVSEAKAKWAKLGKENLTESDRRILESAIKIPVIDIVPDVRRINKLYKNMTPEDNAYQFLSRVVMPSFKTIKIKGVKNIVDALPDSIQVINAIEEYTERRGVSRDWDITLQRRFSINTGINSAHVGRLAIACGLQLVQIVDMLHLVVRIPPALVNEPKTVMAKAINEDKEDAIEYQHDKLKERVVPSRRPDTEISQSASYYYIETLGSNIQDVLGLPGVDTNRTYSTNPVEDFQVFGIESARNRLLREFNKVFSKGGDLLINPRNVTLLADFMTIHGTITPLTYKGMTAHAPGFLTQAGFEQPMDVFKNAAIKGDMEATISSSANIFVGQRSRIGAESVSVNIDRDRLEEFTRNAGDIQIDENMLEEVVNSISASGSAAIDRHLENTVDADTEITQNFDENVYSSTTSISTAPGVPRPAPAPAPTPHPANDLQKQAFKDIGSIPVTEHPGTTVVTHNRYDQTIRQPDEGSSSSVPMFNLSQMYSRR